MNNKVNYFGIATLFIGTVIGAGFASGQELIQFFGNYGFKGIMGTLLVGLCFTILSIVIMFTAKNINSIAFEEVAVPNVKALRIFVNGIITFLSFGILVVMIAGAGAMLNTLTGLSPIIGNISMTIIIISVSWFGTESMLNSFNIVVPVMIVIAIITGILGIATGPGKAFMPPVAAQTISKNWLLSALLFVSYNFALSLAVLAPLGVKAKDKKSIVIGSIIGGVTLGSVATLLCIAIVKNFKLISNTSLPVFILAQNQNKFLGWAYGFVLLAAIFTTAEGILFALLERFSQYKVQLFKNRRVMLVSISTLALVGSNVGFSKLVSVLYPINGYLGFFVIAFLLYNYVATKKQLKVESKSCTKNAA